MALNWRQTRLYIHEVDLYRPKTLVIDPTTHDMGEYEYPLTPTYSNVKCHRTMKVEKVDAELVGVTLENIIFTIDTFSFDKAQEIGTAWAMQFHKTGHVEDGGWLYVIGEPKVKDWRANKLLVLAKRSVAPRRTA